VVALCSRRPERVDLLSSVFGEPEAVCADVRGTVPERIRPNGTTLVVDADDRELELCGSGGRIALSAGVQDGGMQVSVHRVGDEPPGTLVMSERAIRSGYELPKRRAAGAIQSLALMLEELAPRLLGRTRAGRPDAA